MGKVLLNETFDSPSERFNHLDKAIEDYMQVKNQIKTDKDRP